MKLAYDDGWMAGSVNSQHLYLASNFNQLGQYVSSPGNRTHCYTELAISSSAVFMTTASTHFANRHRDAQCS